jgi:mono/diheme cytochrome c family protein
MRYLNPVLGLAAAVVVPFAGLALVLSTAVSSPAARLTRGTLVESFDADIRNLVVEWSPDDPRSEEERRQALLSFIYQTYESSAWIPQSLFDSNLATQIVGGDVDTIIRERVGLTPWPENRKVPAYGMAPSADPAQPLMWTVNCVICHTAEIDGVAYFGAGTKVFDDKVLGDALKSLTSPAGRRLLARGSAANELAARANDILTRHHHDKIDSLTRARSTAFAASHVELYMRPNGGRMPSNDEVGRGDVKVPPLWHTAAKMQAGRWYADGSFHGQYPLMASSMELEKDRSFETLETIVVPTIRREFETVVRHLKPPRYPYEIDPALAAEGRALFYSEEVGCSRCHGVYDGRGNVVWPGRHEDVGTDRGRLDVVNRAFVDAFESSPLAAHGRLKPSEGYAATPLTGVWASYPYLHNGSVPTLHHLLGPAAERPRIFNVMAARRFDRQRVGQLLYQDDRAARLDEAALIAQYGGRRDWFNTARDGCDNSGHDVWRRIRTDARRKALIEYLKTL